MKLKLLICLLALCGPQAQAQVRIEHDGKRWLQEVRTPELQERIAREGLLVVADDASQVGMLFRGFSLDASRSHSIRFEVRGADDDAVELAPFTEFKGERQFQLIVTCEPEVVAVAMTFTAAGAAPEVHLMNADFLNSDGCKETIQNAVAAMKQAKEPPLAHLAIRSACSYGQMVRLLRLLRNAGCAEVLIRIDDAFPSMNIEVRPDPSVEPPVVVAPDPNDPAHIRIDLAEDGSATGDDGIGLATDEEVSRYIVRRRGEILQAGLKPRIRLKGDKQVMFQKTRRIIRIAADAGVDQVVFSVNSDQGEQLPNRDHSGLQPQPRHVDDLDMKLPGNPPERPGILLGIEKNGQIWIDKPGNTLDRDPADRNVPKIREELVKLKMGNKDASLIIRVDPDVPQQRVIDVLNACAFAEIEHVRFEQID